MGLQSTRLSDLRVYDCYDSSLIKFAIGFRSGKNVYNSYTISMIQIRQAQLVL